jgi:NAD-dependent DNA ligase
MKIEIPTNCPTCDSTLKLINAQLFCRNNECEAQSFKKIETFAKNMKIKGLGPRTIEKLNLETIPDIYLLDEISLVGKLGEKLGKKLFAEIDKSKKCDFATFLSSLSIPLIGKTASKKIAETGTNSLNQLCYDPLNKVLGPKALKSLDEWLETNYEFYIDLPIEFIKKKVPIKRLGKVCITGKLNDFANRTVASEYLEGLGYTTVTTVNRQTNYLVDEEGKPSSKSNKAKELNINIVTIKQLEEIANNE